jgi:hypothetical protein
MTNPLKPGRLLTLAIACLLVLCPAFGVDARPDDLVARLQNSLAAKDLASYLGIFVPGLREQEAFFFEDLFVRLKMEKVTLRRAGSAAALEAGSPLYVQAFFENSFSALQETWRLIPLPSEEGWVIQEKKITGDITNLYRIAIPSGRVERASRVEVSHQDIRLTFTDALVFYDNLPDLPTALIVMGRGRLQYSPSVPAEQHQLDLALGRPALDEGLDHAYLRFSPGFFRDHIRIVGETGDRAAPPSQVDLRRAHSIFARDYPRSFTVEYPLNGELYSALPQSEEVVFELQTASGREFTYINSPFAREEIHFFDRGRDRLINLYSPPEEPGQRRMIVSLGSRLDVQHCEVEIDFTPRTAYFSAVARLTIQSRVDRLDSLKLELNPNLEIVHLYDEAGKELFYTRDNLRRLLYVYLINPVPRDSLFRVDIYYRGRLEPPEALTDVVTLPTLTRQGTVIMPVNSETYFYTHSARWYPSPFEEDYFTGVLRLIVPPEYQVVATGRLSSLTRLNNIKNVEAIEKVGRSVYTFETRTPVKYLSFIVGRFEKAAESESDPPGALYMTPSIYLRARDLWDMSRSILAFYQKLFGSYPFEKLDVVQRLWPTGGGNSPASFVILDEIPRAPDSHMILDSRSPVDFSHWKEYFLSHEIAHQWWGQGVSWDTYHDQWLSEGLAQLSSVLYLRDKYGEKSHLDILKKLCDWTRKESDAGAVTLGSRLSHLDFRAYQALVYDKSTLALLMLEQILGPETFQAGLREFFQARRWSPSRTSHFRRAMEKVSGRDLETFFHGWFDSYALPRTRLIWSLVRNEGTSVMRVTSDQLGDVFVFPLTLEWREGRRTIRRTIILDRKTQQWEFELGTKPRKFRADPDRIFPGKIDVDH